MLKLFLLFIFLLPTTSYIHSEWNLQCYQYTSRFRGRPYVSGPYFKYCAIEFFPTKRAKTGYEVVALGYNYMLGTADEQIDDAFADNSSTIAVLVEKKKEPGDRESTLYVCRTFLCNAGSTPHRFLEYQELVKTKKPEELQLVWEIDASDALIFQNDQIQMKNESHEPIIID